MKPLMKYATVALVILLGWAMSAQAETLKRRYTLPFKGGAMRTASRSQALNQAKQRFLADFLKDKFSETVIQEHQEDIDIALDPPTDYVLDFQVKSEKINPDETQITLTVEGNLDLPKMVAALVNNDVLSFVDKPPRVMVIPAGSFTDPLTAKKLRAMIYDQLKQAGLQPVAFEGITEVTAAQIKSSPEGVRMLAKKALEYKADYLMHFDVEADNRPFSQGGYVCDANFIYTLMRPYDNTILGESLFTGREGGNSSMVAFTNTLESVKDQLVLQAVGQLFRSIFEDSDVITDTKQLKNAFTLTVFFKDNPGQVQAIIDGLQALGATVQLGVGAGAGDRLQIETTMDQLSLYNYLNDQTFSANGVKFKSPVVDYTENTISVEIVKAGVPAKKPVVKNTPPPRKEQQADLGSTSKKGKPIILKLKGNVRPPSFA